MTDNNKDDPGGTHLPLTDRRVVNLPVGGAWGTLAEPGSDHRPRNLDDEDRRMMGVPTRPWGAKLAKVSPESTRQQLANYVGSICEVMKGGIGLIVVGPPAAGKSSVAAIAAKAARHRRWTVQWFAARDLIAAVRNNAEIQGMSAEQACQSVDLLVIDNFESILTDRYYGEEWFLLILKKRADYQRSSVVVVTESGYERMTNQLHDTISGMCLLEVPGGDARVQSANEALTRRWLDGGSDNG